MIVLFEPGRPAGFDSGGYRYQQAVMAPLAAQGRGRLVAVAPTQLAAELHELRVREPRSVPVVDGLFAATAPLPPGTLALLHMVPEVAAWSAAPLPVVATAASTAASERVRARALAVEVVTPGLDACFTPAPMSSRRPGQLRVVCIGTFGPGKGQLALAHALAAANVPCELVLLGAGTEHRSAIASLASAKQLGVHTRGVVPPAAVAAALHDSDLCVSWSRSESFGMAVAEAVACGVPVLAFATGAIADHVQHGANGWLLPTTADDAAMAAQLHALLRQPERLVAARAAAASHRSSLPPWDVVAERFAAACQRLAMARGRGGAT
jgi:hypothetical protein